MRIVSLVPSATEVVCELGLEEQLVGVSGDCDWPEAVRDKPVLSQTIAGDDLSSEAVDSLIHQRVHHGRSVYHLDANQLRALAPDLILTQERCEVCAPAFSEVRGAAQLLEGRTRLVSLEPTTLDEILETIQLVGELTGRQREAETLVGELRARITRVRDRAELAEDVPRALCLEWLDPLYVAGHWVPELVELAGGQSWGEAGAPSFPLDGDALARFNPEVIVLMPCGLDPQRTAGELEVLTSHEAWDELSAVKGGRVFLAHGSFYFSRPGPRVVTGLEILAKALHPERFGDVSLPEGALYRLEGR